MSALGNVWHSRRNISGEWRGTYRYDLQKSRTIRAPVDFTLTLNQGWFGRFEGAVANDQQHGMPGTGRVKGRYSFPSIRFVKQMPVAYVGTMDHEKLSFVQWLSNHGIGPIGDLAHPPILYTGEFIDVSRAHGTWVIQGRTIQVDEQRVVQFPTATGRWDFHRV